MSKILLTVMGIAFLAVGLSGYMFPGMMGMHLSPAHNIIHLVSGLAALYFGMFGSFKGARIFAFVFGLAYGMLGVLGLLADPGVSVVVQPNYEEHLMVLSPNVLEFGVHDSIAHVVLGIIFVAISLIPIPFATFRTTESERPMSSIK